MVLNYDIKVNILVRRIFQFVSLEQKSSYRLCVLFEDITGIFWSCVCAEKSAVMLTLKSESSLWCYSKETIYVLRIIFLHVILWVYERGLPKLKETHKTRECPTVYAWDLEFMHQNRNESKASRYWRNSYCPALWHCIAKRVKVKFKNRHKFDSKCLETVIALFRLKIHKLILFCYMVALLLKESFLSSGFLPLHQTVCKLSIKNP